MTARQIHAISIEPGTLATVCGLALSRDTTCTGWGRPQQAVCPDITCTDCEVEMGLRHEFPMPPIGHLLTALGVDPTTATDDPPRVLFVGDQVFIHYTGLIKTTPAEFSQAASKYLPDGWKPA